MKKILFLLFVTLSLLSCNKTKNKLLFSGKVYSPNESKNLAGVTVELQAQLIESSMYNSNFQSLQKVTTDANGNYNIENDNVRASTFKLLVYDNNYIRSETEINSELVNLGKSYKKDFDIYPKAYLKIYVRNVTPADATDEISISVQHTSPGCDICSTIQNLILTGDNINDTLICLIYGNQTVTVDYTTNTASGLNHYIHDEYCTAFETKEFAINY